MARRALVLASWVCSTLGLAIPACGSSDENPFDKGRGRGDAGEGGESTSGTGGAVADAGEAGGGVAASGGSRGGSTSRGGSAGSTSSTGGTSTGGSGGTSTGGTGGVSGGIAGGEGGAAGGGPPDPVVCDRLAGLDVELAARVALAYDLRRHRDCRLAWFETLFLPPIDETAEYLRAIARQTRILWGCIDEPLSGFSLVYGEVPLSQAEVDALIGVYLDASGIEVQLSPSEVAPIGRALEELAEPLVDPTLEGFSRSRCPDGGVGGQSGAGGQGGEGGQSGAGGQNDAGGVF